jgi:PhnB protein
MIRSREPALVRQETTMPVKPIPDGHTAITPYLVAKGAAKAIDFYKKAFGAVEDFRMQGEDGKIGHAELTFGGARIMLADEYPPHGAFAPEGGRHSVAILLYVPDVDATFARAVALGAVQCRAVADQFYGDRSGVLKDPFGHCWIVATHKEDLTSDEMQRRAASAQPKG